MGKVKSPGVKTITLIYQLYNVLTLVVYPIDHLQKFLLKFGSEFVVVNAVVILLI